MVALNADFAPSKTSTDTKNRVGRFFSLAAEPASVDQPPSRNRIGEKRVYGYETASVDTEFEYGPFGELIRSTGSKKDDFRFRFSTKYQDAETGLLYYGFRYYDAVTGRWLSRDPIEEQGGPNLYGMVFNDPVSYWDYLGLVIPASAFRGNYQPPASAYDHLISPDAYVPDALKPVVISLNGMMEAIISGLPRYPTPGFAYGQSYPVGTVGVVSVKAGWGFSGKVQCCKRKDGAIGFMAVGKFEINFGGGIGLSGEQTGKLPKRNSKPSLEIDALATSSLPDCKTTVEDFKIAVKVSGQAAAGLGAKISLPIGEYSAADGLSLTIKKGPEAEIILGGGASVDLTGSGAIEGSIELN